MPTPSPGQTIGPFFHYALPYPGDRDLVAPGTPGAVLLHGTVTDGEGNGVPDALVEIWQADPGGRVPRSTGSLRRDGHTFTGWGRSSTDRTGRYTFTTLPPGSVDGALPFFAVTVFARGLLHRLLTRAYLPLDGAEPDGLLGGLGDRASTLLCLADDAGLRFDIALQGAGETVFLAYPGH
jgi:protocatechuate 3,4-dioxygenase alpha subunit